MSALSGLKDRIDSWRHRRAALREFEDMGPEARDALSRDVGVSSDGLGRLIARGSGSADGLYRLLRVLGLDRERIARDRALMRDMEIACSCCEAASQCARDLDAGRAQGAYQAYCPNAATLAALLQERGDAEPKLAPAHAGFPVDQQPAPSHWRWPMTRRVERQARLMGAMMERVGVDPGAAAREGSGAAFAAASRRCMACSSAEECERWLNEGGGDLPPEFCPNEAFLIRTQSRSVHSPH